MSRLIDIDDDRNCYIGMDGEYEKWNIDPNVIADAQSESYDEKLNEIASDLSEKFAYMNTCLNERDIILGYLGVKRSCETHCNTDCTNTKCESHPSSAQPEAISLEWIDKHLEWLDNCDNDFAQLAKVGIRAMVELWKKDRT